MSNPTTQIDMVTPASKPAAKQPWHKPQFQAFDLSRDTQAGSDIIADQDPNRPS